MSSIYYLKLCQQHTGLCNQLNSLLSTICYCIMNNNKQNIIVIEHFLQEIQTENYMPISNLFNIKELNVFLEKYNIQLVDGYFTNNLKILNATYGFEESIINVTHIINTLFLNNDNLVINKNINLNNLFGDVAPNKQKQIKIDFILDNNKFKLTFLEDGCFLNNNIDINFKNKNYIMAPDWALIDKTKLIDDIYKNFNFNNNLFLLSDNFINKLLNNSLSESISGLKYTNNINIIHLRIEQDAIDHWSVVNKLSKHIFYEKIIEKYIYLINKLIMKNDKTIILSYSSENIIIDYLKNNNYNYYYCEKIKNNNREYNAIIDLLNSRHCNNLFIGVGGSTFSHYISKMSNSKQVEMIDFNNINN